MIEHTGRHMLTDWVDIQLPQMASGLPPFVRQQEARPRSCIRSRGCAWTRVGHGTRKGRALGANCSARLGLGLKPKRTSRPIQMQMLRWGNKTKRKDVRTQKRQQRHALSIQLLRSLVRQDESGRQAGANEVPSGPQGCGCSRHPRIRI